MSLHSRLVCWGSFAFNRVLPLQKYVAYQETRLGNRFQSRILVRLDPKVTIVKEISEPRFFTEQITF